MRRIEFDHKHNLYLVTVTTYNLSESFIELVKLGRMYRETYRLREILNIEKLDHTYDILPTDV